MSFDIEPSELVMPESVENDEELSDVVANPSDEGDDWEDGEEASDDSEDEPVDDDESEDDEDSDDDDEVDEDEEDPEDLEVKETIQNLTAQGDACAELLAKSGISYLDLVAEFQEDGHLSKGSLKALADAGYPKDLVMGYIEGQQARMDIYSDRVKAIAGGEKEYAKLMKWAARNLTPKEIAHYDKAVESFDIDEARFAIEGLMARHERKVGVKPEIVRGRSATTEKAVKGFASLEEMAKAQDDPRYETDVAYTRMVERRMLASDF